jgi:hypothetical protein
MPAMMMMSSSPAWLESRTFGLASDGLGLQKNAGRAKAASNGWLWLSSGLSRGPSTVSVKLQ